MVGIGSIGKSTDKLPVIELLIKDTVSQVEDTQTLIYLLGSECLGRLLGNTLHFNKDVLINNVLANLENQVRNLPTTTIELLEELENELGEIGHLDLDWISLELFSRYLILKQHLLTEIRRVDPALTFLTTPQLKWVKNTTHSTWYAITLHFKGN